ncbi:MAG: tetratricopeptide repeat protein, partial [Gammaproteobacteria bacterium]|nr:tetratricopeptide repeat protein [Gammaproteobacteria bacterium]
MNTVRRNALSCRPFLLCVVISGALALGCSTAMAQSVDYDSLLQTAIGQRNAGNMPAAEQTFRQAWEIADNKSEAAYLLALVIAFQDRYEEAITLLDATLIDYPQDTNLLLA